MIRIASVAVGLLLLALPLPASAQTSFEDQVLAELNALRENPSAYVEDLSQYRRYYQANMIVIPDVPVRYLTQEGTVPLDEAIAYLRRQARRDRLAPAGSLASAAADHCTDQASDGAVGHVGADGTSPGDRVVRRGGGIYVSEVIAYGADSPADVVRQLLIDDGVPDRSHRELLFADRMRFAGVSCGTHPVYRTMCVVDFARTPDGRARVQYAQVDPAIMNRHWKP